MRCAQGFTSQVVASLLVSRNPAQQMRCSRGTLLLAKARLKRGLEEQGGGCRGALGMAMGNEKTLQYWREA